MRPNQRMGEGRAPEQSEAAETLREDPAPREQGSGDSVAVHVHKPKPWHGLTELLREYAIVVLGVLTALAAEQAVEGLHHRAQVREMTQKMQVESEENRHVIDYDVENVRAALASTDAVLAALAKGEAVAPELQRTDLFTPADAAWIAIRDSALLPIMPKLLVDNAWKVDATQVYLRSKMEDLVRASDQADAALNLRRSAPHDADLERTARLRLAELQVQESRLIVIFGVFRGANEQMLRGERIDTVADLQKARAQRRN
jgi:hypothetical protein